jgi:hypothetical protein
LANISEITPELREGLDKHTWTEFHEEKTLFHLPLELVVVFDPPLELSRPPGGHRFGSVVDLGKDVVRSRQISIDDLLRDAARRDVHAFVNDPSTDMLRRATSGHLLELDQQLHRLFERAFAGRDVIQAEEVSREGVVSAHEFVLREIERRRIQTVEEDSLAASTRALAEMCAKQRDIVALREMVTKQEPTTVQTLIFSKDVFQSAEEAIAWAREHDFKFDKVDETETSYRLRQREPGEFQDESFRTIDLTEGVQAVIGRLKEMADKAEKQALLSDPLLVEDVPADFQGEPANAECLPIEKAITHNVRLIKRFEPELEEERFVFGVVLVPGEVDAQGETYTAPTVRKAAHSFMENGGFNKIMHKGEPVEGVVVVENTVSKQVERHNEENFPEGTWFLGVKVRNDEIWKEIKSGSFTGFSMGGTAVRESLVDDLPQAA